ncbi:unnamed protein product [Anisakis simplex]|uniref:DNA topoisomerase (ATP-hydrolyzing) n=1 Tax=Anisakis simplex TaxID=6269 RepID=A0A0M3K1B3_ANISI|nr:unnamed protein product [Anisakis simplex]
MRVLCCRALASILTTGPLTMNEYTEMLARSEDGAKSRQQHRIATKIDSTPECIEIGIDQPNELSKRALYMLNVEDVMGVYNKEMSEDPYDALE